MRRHVQVIEDEDIPLPWQLEAIFLAFSVVATGGGTAWVLFQMISPMKRFADFTGYQLDITPLVAQYWPWALVGGAVWGWRGYIWLRTKVLRAITAA